MPSLVVLQLLSLLPNNALVTPGYALRVTQAAAQYYMSTDGTREVADILASAPWPTFRIVAAIAEAERRRRPNLDTDMVEAEAPSRRPAAQLPGFAPLNVTAATRLYETLLVAHRFLELLGIPYIAIAGTLLGALRHFGRIPWDDDVDLCVDATRENTLLNVVVAIQARRLGIGWLRSLPLRSRRAARFLEQAKYVLSAEAARSLVFRVTSVGSPAETVSVDIWQCWGLEDSSDTVSMMSRLDGPVVPKAWILPRQKVPFHDLAIWVPAEPEKVTGMYLSRDGGTEDWRTTCRGRKAHAVSGTVQYSDVVSCSEFAAEYVFAGPWRVLDNGHQRQDVVTTLATLIKRRLPEARLVAETLILESAMLGNTEAPRLRAAVDIALGSGDRWSCRGLFWHSPTEDDDLLAPGLVTLANIDHPDSVGSGWPAPIRSLICGHDSLRTGAEYVWEEDAL